MPKELLKITDGTYTLEETGKENELFFFRNDKEVLGDVGQIPFKLFSRYIVEKVTKGEFQGNRYQMKIHSDISSDGKVIRLTISDDSTECPKLRIVKSGETEPSSKPKTQQPKPNFFKRIFRKRDGK